MVAIGRGPRRLWMTPANRNIDASITMSMVGTSEVWVRVQPKSCSRAGTKTLQA